ncbi:hypothetical protein JCM10908_002590 [Rhodotorula pacifica]|uniref:uncharacterized protein n=1 Tax=Rhodotorula pacifica TaxID=1495444 RepID=UPI003177F607
MAHLHQHQDGSSRPGDSALVPLVVDASDDNDEHVAPEPEFPTRGTYVDKVPFVYNVGLRHIQSLRHEERQAARLEAGQALAAAETWTRDVLATGSQGSTKKVSQSPALTEEMNQLRLRIDCMCRGNLLPWPPIDVIKKHSPDCHSGSWLSNRIQNLTRQARDNIGTILATARRSIEEDVVERQREAASWRDKMLKHQVDYGKQGKRWCARVDTNLKTLAQNLGGLVLAEKFNWPQQLFGAFPSALPLDPAFGGRPVHTATPYAQESSHFLGSGVSTALEPMSLPHDASLNFPPPTSAYPSRAEARTHDPTFDALPTEFSPYDAYGRHDGAQPYPVFQAPAGQPPPQQHWLDRPPQARSHRRR